jgi:hypothetical protein
MQLFVEEMNESMAGFMVTLHQTCGWFGRTFGGRMENIEKKEACVNCERTALEIPLLKFQFQGEERGICTNCLPILLHRPSNLIGRLPGAENIKPAKHSH